MPRPEMYRLLVFGPEKESTVLLKVGRLKAERTYTSVSQDSSAKE
jgi:hypothetical protein